MEFRRAFVLTIMLFCTLLSCRDKEKIPVDFEIVTSLGNVGVHLYDDNELHKAQLLSIIRDGYYNNGSISFLGKDSLIQLETDRGNEMQNNPTFLVTPEITRKQIMKKGSIVAFRNNDIVKADFNSVLTKLNIITGKTYSKEELDTIENYANKMKFDIWLGYKIADPTSKVYKEMVEIMKRINYVDGSNVDSSQLKLIGNYRSSLFDKWVATGNSIQYTGAEKEVYQTLGGMPYFDGQYTIVGEVIYGFDILDKINALKTDTENIPYQRFEMEFVIRK